MERMKVLIADDDEAHLEQVFKTVNAWDPLTSEGKIWTGEGQLVEQVAEQDISDRSVEEFPLQLRGNIEILCAKSYEGALHLIKKHGDVDVCISDVQFSGENADGPSILSVCGVKPENGILYTAQSKKKKIYRGSNTYIRDKRGYEIAEKGRFRVVRYGIDDFEDIIYSFLMDSEHLLAKNRIQDTGLSNEAKASWRSFEKELNNLLSGDSPDRSDLKSCETALYLEGGLEETTFGDTQFKHLFPLRKAFLSRQLIRTEEVLDGRADETYPSWDHIKNKTKVRIQEISHLILDQNDTSDAPGAVPKNINPKEIEVNLQEEPTVYVGTSKKNINYESSDLRNSGLFLLLSVIISDRNIFPIEDRIDTEYKRKKLVSIFLSSLLVNKFRAPSRKPGYLIYEQTIDRPSGTKNKRVDRKEINKTYVANCLKEEEMHHKEIEEDLEYECEIISLPQNSYNHKNHLMTDLGIDGGIEILESEDKKWKLSEEISSVDITPSWIKKDSDASKDEWAEEFAEEIVS